MAADAKDLHPVEITESISAYTWRSGGSGEGAAAKRSNTYYQMELLTAVLERHLWDNDSGRRASLAGRTFFIEVSDDGGTVKVVEE